MGEFRPSVPGERRGGRQKGTPNKTTALLKDAILRAAEKAGEKLDGSNEGGLVAYLSKQADAQPGAFMSLLGKVLPLQLAGDPENPLQHEHSLTTDAERAAAVMQLLRGKQS